MNATLLTLLLVPFAVLATPANDPPSPRAEAHEGSLDAALRSVQARKIRKDLEFLASDEMAGRDTPSPEQRRAARYLRDRLVELGFAPGGRFGYLSEYSLPFVQLDAGATTLEVAGETLRYGEHFLYPRNQDHYGAHTSAGLVFAGEGDEGDFDAAEGHWALVETPKGSLRRVLRRAEAGGAAGVILLPREGQDPTEQYAKVRDRYAKGTLLRGGYEPIDFPVVALTDDGERALRKAAGIRRTPDVGAEVEIEISEVRALTAPRAYGLFENVIGFWEGSDPDLKREVILVSAHYDHVGVNRGEVYNGADDNGSGTCGLLALAGALAEYGPLRRSVVVMWVSGEEKGLLGSRGWTRRPWLPEGCYPVANINIDMIGRNKPDDLMITPTKDGRVKHEYNGLVALAESFAGEEGFGEFRSADDYWGRSDHANFAQNLGLPVTFLFADIHEDYHQPGDDPDKIDYDKIRRVVRLVMRMIDGMQTDPLELHERPIPTYEQYLEQQQAGMVLDDLERWRLVLDHHRRSEGAAPDQLEELVGSAAAKAANLRGSILKDPWGNAYRYDAAAGTLSTLGADGAEGGEGADADVSLSVN